MAKPVFPKSTNSIGDNQSTITGNVLTNATDPDGDPITVARVDGGYVDPTLKKGGVTFQGQYGVLEIQPNGSYTYTLDPGVNVPTGQTLVEDFGIKVRDGTGLFSSNALVITIVGVDESPIAVDDIITVGGTTAFGNLLTNDSDPDGDVLHVSAVGVGTMTTEHISGLNENTVLTGKYGTLTVNTSGDFVYLLNKTDPDYVALGGAAGTDRFSYKVSDDQSNMDFGKIEFNFV